MTLHNLIELSGLSPARSRETALGCDAVMVAAVIGLAEQFEAPRLRPEAEPIDRRRLCPPLP